MSPRLSPTVEEPSHQIESSSQNQRRSVSEPVSPRGSFGDLRLRATRHRDGSMTCFPKLPSRTCTSDWLTPLGLFEEPTCISQHRATMSDLYARGVDAHLGVDVPKPLEMLEESPRQTPVPIDDSPFQTPGPQWSTHPSEGPESGLKAGRAIGVSTHCRKSSTKPMEAQNSDHNHGLLDKLRRYSFMPLLDQTPESIRGASLPAQTWAEVPLRESGVTKRSSKELLQGILNRRSASKKSSRRSSRPGVRERRNKTVSSAQKRRRSGLGRMSCSEDYQPHICMDEQLTPISGSETAWFE
ncbi:hypothetical protein K449DRAFT_108069 [Hypoxylon sp. EC38]|nr:hypothetical protein K449DRAFT_108069 [Hypoxylon sp. EC38]